MAQYKLGTVTVTNGSTTVTGTGVNWLTGVNFTGPLPMLTIKRSATVTRDQPIGFIVSRTTNTLTLESPWAGDSFTNVEYGIVVDFHPDHGAPLMGFGDYNTHLLLNRAINRIGVATAAALVASESVALMEAARAEAIDLLADIEALNAVTSRVTVSTEPPTGGATGDIWLVVDP